MSDGCTTILVNHFTHMTLSDLPLHYSCFGLERCSAASSGSRRDLIEIGPSEVARLIA